MKAVLPWLVGAWLLAGVGCTRDQAPEEGAPAPPAPENPEPAAAAGAPPAAAPVAEGCSQESISRVVRTRRAEVTACYREAAERDPSLRGRVAVTLGIQPGGRLAHRGIESSDFSVELNTCIVRALDGLAFAPTIEEPCVVVYPFVFSASPRARP